MENLFQNESRLINDLFQSQSPKSIIDVGKQILYHTDVKNKF